MMSKRLFTLKKTARILVSSKNNTNNSNNTDYDKDILIIQQTEQGFPKNHIINFNNHDQRHNLQQHHSTAITFNYSNYPYSQNSKPSFTYMSPVSPIFHIVSTVNSYLGNFNMLLKVLPKGDFLSVWAGYFALWQSSP